MKKIFLSITALAIAVFLSLGCVTKQVWTDKVRGEPYKERIISFYNNTEEKKIIFIGEKYHYIFNERTKNFSEFLEAKKRLKLKESNRGIYANTSRTNLQEVSVNISFEFKKESLNQEQKDWLKGYHAQPIRKQRGVKDIPKYITPAVYEPKESEIDGYALGYYLTGKRYQSAPEVNNHVVKLKNPIDIEVVEYKVKDKKSTLYKVAMTPLSATADAGLIIIGAGVAIVYAPFALAYWAYDSITK